MTRSHSVATPALATLALLAALATPSLSAAQGGMDRERMGGRMGMGMMGGGGAPSQAAFATIQEIVKKLKADPATDWSKVNLEALRQHLIDMDNVVMRASVRQSDVEGGVSLDVTGTGAVADAIKRMGAMHAMALNEDGTWKAASSEIANGVRLVVTAKDLKDAKAVAMVRGLGFAGILTEGDHHAMHHLMLAKGEGMSAAGHQHKP
jgi:ribose 5-phosphate isomerase RpiB